MDVRQEIVSADAWLIHDSFRSQVARWIVDWNWPGGGRADPAPACRRRTRTSSCRRKGTS